MKHLILAVTGLFIVLAAYQLQAQDKPSKAERRAAALDLRNDMRTWFEADVYPSLKKWHQEYDASLSAEDLATLNKYRSEAKQLKDAMRKDMMALKGTMKKGDREEMQEQMEALREKHHDAMENIIDGVKPIMKRSREKLRSIFDSNEDQIEAWRDKAREIMKTWRSENQGMGRGGRKGHGPKGMDMPLMGQDGKHAALKFVLWDGIMPPMDESMLGNDPFSVQTGQNRNNLGQMKVSPAPSGNAATISVNNVPNGSATLEIFDMNGALVRSMNVTSSNGTIEQRVDLSGLPAGSYMASVNTAQGRRTSQIVKE